MRSLLLAWLLIPSLPLWGLAFGFGWLHNLGLVHEAYDRTLLGSALVLGLRVRLAAGLALLMVINFHIAADVMLRYDYLINAYGLPVLGGLLALAVGGSRLPFSVSK